MHYYGYDVEETGKIICPFHDDINPSMKINLEEGNFYCFGCNLSGDAIKFVKLMNPNLDEIQVLKKYFKILNSTKVKKKKIKRISKKKKKEEFKQYFIEAQDYYFNLLQPDWKKEKISEKEYMRKRGFLPSTLNLCKAKYTYNDNYPLIFPIFDMGEFKGYVCRTISPEIEKKRKYLYNKGFSRSNTLVGEYDAETVIIVEGYMDWLKLRQYGFKKVAAILGWKITQIQIEKLKKEGVKNVICMLDNDKAGRKGKEYLKNFFNVLNFKLPVGVNDPGDLTRQQAKKIKKKLEGLNWI